MTLGSFILIKNEAPWIGPHLASWLPHLDEMVFFDGNSTDGTLEIIREFQERHEDGKKIKLFLDKDPADLQDAYVKMFDECMRSLSTDMAFFLHPDQILADPWRLGNIPEDCVAASCDMDSFAGDPGGQLLKIKTGRADKWMNIYRLRNPDLGAHYWGHYGAANEAVYFNAITGNQHDHYGHNFGNYPYPVFDTGCKILHFSDVRTYERRYGRMVSALMNQGLSPAAAEIMARAHPRVILQDYPPFTFEKADYPQIFKTWKEGLRPAIAA